METFRSAPLRSGIEPVQQLKLWSEEASPWRIRQSQRARRLAARVFRDGSVEIVVPPRTSAATVSAFVARYQQWIVRQQARIQPVAPEPFPPRQIHLEAIGQMWICESHERLRPGQVHIALEPLGERPGILHLGNAADQSVLLRRLREWLLDRARLAFAVPLATTAREMGTVAVQLKVRRQRTRWGSCTAAGSVSLNCCALFQRPPVLRYLLVHELAHLRHMNHSSAFWAHVERYEPDYRRLDRELGAGWQRVPHWALAIRHA